MHNWSRGIGGVLLVTALTVVVPAATPVGADGQVCTSTVTTAATTDVAPTGFVAITPARIADTRVGTGVPIAPVGDGCVLRVPLAAADPPSTAVAAALTVTSDRAGAAGFVTAYPCGSSRPDTSILNQRPGDPTPNLAVVAIDSTREVCFYADHQTDLVVDVTGWFTPSGDPLHEMTPTRVLDTRVGPVPAGTALGPVANRTIAIPLAGGVVPSEAAAVAVTVTITQAAATTFATAYPCGSALPPTSTNNTLAGRDRGAPAIVGLGGGSLCVYSSSDAHLLVDVTGWYGPDASTGDTDIGSPLEVVSTTRIADSRNAVTWADAPFTAGEEKRLGVLGSVALGTTAAQLNVIANGALGDGFLSVYPCAAGRPSTSAVNFRRGATETAMVTVALDTGGEICVYASAATDVVVDLFAGYGSPGSLHALVASPNPMGQGVSLGQIDHSLRCPSSGTVTLDLDPSPGVRASLDGDASVAGPRRIVKTGVVADQLIRIDLTGAVTETHYVRCLPSDFPALTATGRATAPGWYFASTLGPNYVFVLDEYGVPVWYKKTTFPMIAAWVLGNGTTAWRRWTGGGFPGGNGNSEPTPLGFELHDLSGAKVGDVGPVNGTEPLDWHEILELPGGGHAVITYPIRNTGTPRTCTRATDGSTTTTTRVVDSDIVELDASGNEVWRWSSSTKTNIATETQIPVCFDTAVGFALDYMHLNSLERLADGDYVISARHFNSIERIDRTTGNVEWKIGGTAPTTGTLLSIRDANGASAGAGARPIGPHDARVAPNGDVTVHDNHIGGAPRMNEYRLDLNAGTATLVAQRISTNPFGGTLGSARRQPDGSTVIGWGEGTNPWLEDLSPAGVATLRVTLPSGVISYRGVKVPQTTWDRAVLRAASGGAAV